MMDDKSNNIVKTTRFMDVDSKYDVLLDFEIWAEETISMCSEPYLPIRGHYEASLLSVLALCDIVMLINDMISSAEPLAHPVPIFILGVCFQLHRNQHNPI